MGHAKQRKLTRKIIGVMANIKHAEKKYRINLKRITNEAGRAITKSLDKKIGIYGYTYMQVLISAQESMMSETNMFPR